MPIRRDFRDRANRFAFSMTSAPEPTAYLNGDYVPLSEARVSVFDLGLVQGAGVTEMVRTFAHRPFRLDEHLRRLHRSVRAVGFPLELRPEDLRSVVLELVERNGRLIPETHDLGVVAFVTPGQNPTYAGTGGPDTIDAGTVCVHTFPLPFEMWAEDYGRGQHLVVPSVRHIPSVCLDPRIKSRSRLHWYSADKQAKLVDSRARALLLDLEGNITETGSGNFFIVENNEIRTPPLKHVLGGVSRLVVSELAESLNLRLVETDLQPYDVVNADEAFTSSTPYCLLPVTRFNGQTVGDGHPGPVFNRLAEAWSELVGVNVVEQMRRGAAERTSETT